MAHSRWLPWSKYLGGMALNYFQHEATDYVADKMTGPNPWSVEKGQADGSGFVLGGSIALGGLGSIKVTEKSIPLSSLRNGE